MQPLTAATLSLPLRYARQFSWVPPTMLIYKGVFWHTNLLKKLNLKKANDEGVAFMVAAKVTARRGLADSQLDQQAIAVTANRLDAWLAFSGLAGAGADLFAQLTNAHL